MNVLVLSTCTALATFHATTAAFCHSAPKPGAQTNMLPINITAPSMERSVPNGHLSWAGPPAARFPVVHVYGSAYERGYAHGQLLSTQVQAFINAAWQYMEQQVESNLPTLPAWLSKLIAEVGLDAAMGLTWDLVRPFTSGSTVEELQGLAAGSGVNFTLALYVHLLPSLTQGDCSMVGAWGSATASGGVVQLRALDWDTDGPFRDHPAVLIAHPADGDGHAYASVGFVGWVGVITGQSAAQLAVSEIGVSYPDATFGNESRAGIPFVFLLRDILQYDTSLSQATQRIATANRTCDLILGVGSAADSSFLGYEVSASVADAMTDATQRPVAAWHPKIPSMVYWGMDWLCPTYTQALANQLEPLHGKLTPELMIQQVPSVVQTGDLHVAVYDLAKQYMFVSFMRASNGTGELYAYDRQYTQLNLGELFAFSAPDSAT